jgi:hypothetical protein
VGVSVIYYFIYKEKNIRNMTEVLPINSYILKQVHIGENFFENNAKNNLDQCYEHQVWLSFWQKN